MKLVKLALLELSLIAVALCAVTRPALPPIPKWCLDAEWGGAMPEPVTKSLSAQATHEVELALSLQQSNHKDAGTESVPDETWLSSSYMLGREYRWSGDHGFSGPCEPDYVATLTKDGIYYHDDADCWHGSKSSYGFFDWRKISPQLLPCPKCVHGQLKSAGAVQVFRI